VAKAMFTRIGYAVLEALEGVEAVRLFQEYENEVAYVLFDLNMHRMNRWKP